MAFKSYMEKCCELVDKMLAEILDKDDPKVLYEPARYHVLGGGKRVRPFMCMASCEAVGGSPEDAVGASVALELVHSFTLVHDDVMDRDEMRRGRETVFKKWGDAAAINLGDAIFSLAYEAMLGSSVEPGTKLNALKALTDAVLEVSEGQMMDISFERKDITLAQYEDMAMRKTGALFRGSTKIGVIVGGGSEEVAKALGDYGAEVGLAFQIWDDYIDFASSETGKTFGSDIKRGKRTSVVCHALENSKAEDQKRLVEILGNENTTDEMVREAVELLERSGSIKYAKDRAVGLVNDAKKKLDVLEDSEAKDALLGFADFVVSRGK